MLNQVKHHVSFEIANLVFDDPHHISIQDRYENGEERWQTMGLVDGVILLVVGHTVYENNGEEVIRIISARKATKREKIWYEQADKAKKNRD